MIWACIGCLLAGLYIGAAITFVAMSLCIAIGESEDDTKN